jgi:hypothetical protein
MAARAAASQSFSGPEVIGSAAGLLLLIFQAGEALVMDLRDADQGADVFAVLFL